MDRKVNTISATFGHWDSHTVIQCLQAAFAPFGSLVENVNGKELAEAMLSFVDADHAAQPPLAEPVIRILWDTSCSEFATPEFRGYQIIIRTPTSGTEIKFSKTKRDYQVEIDFGAKGSEHRALHILAGSLSHPHNFDFVVKHQGETIPWNEIEADVEDFAEEL